MNAALAKGRFPPEWKDVVATMMTTKAPAESPNNQRLVVLMNTIYKLFSIIINCRLTRIMEENGVIEHEQEGGQQYRGCL